MSEACMESIVNRIKKRRLELGYSFQELANMTNMSKSTLQRYETGAIKNLPLSKLEILANALRTTPEWIMGWKDELDKAKTLIDETADLTRRAFGADNLKRMHLEMKDNSVITTLSNVTLTERQLIVAFWKLNESGRAEAIKRVCELGELKQYVDDDPWEAMHELKEIDENLLSSDKKTPDK